MSLETLQATTCTRIIGHLVNKFKDTCAFWEIEKIQTPEGKIFEFRQFSVIEIVDEHSGLQSYRFHSGNAQEYEILVHMLGYREPSQLHLGVI